MCDFYSIYVHQVHERRRQILSKETTSVMCAPELSSLKMGFVSMLRRIVALLNTTCVQFVANAFPPC